MHWTVRLRRWWQRNFGHVYLTETRWNGETACYRFKARLGKVALCWWPIDFVCKLAPNGDIINHCWEEKRGFGKPYPGWKWSYEPVGTVIGKGGAWQPTSERGQMKIIKLIINRLLRRRCRTCDHWIYARFSMGTCGKGPFFSLSTTLDSTLACECWKRKKGKVAK